LFLLYTHLGGAQNKAELHIFAIFFGHNTCKISAKPAKPVSQALLGSGVSSFSLIDPNLTSNHGGADALVRNRR
jgi:hypothetical protein